MPQTISEPQIPAASVDYALKARLDELIAELGAIPSPQAMRARVAELVAAAGYAQQSVDAVGNLLARPSAGSQTPLSNALFCARLDTIATGQVAIESVLVNDGTENGNNAILGADNKAAIAVIIACLERWQRAGDRPPLTELLFTTGEELGLVGAKHFDTDLLRSDIAYIYDQDAPIGGLVVASPSFYRLDATFIGDCGRQAAERAIASLPDGAIDSGTAVHSGHINGLATATVAGVSGSERYTLRTSVRSLDEHKAIELVGQINDRLQRAAGDRRNACDLNLHIERLFCGYRHQPEMPQIVFLADVLKACGKTVEYLDVSGGSDANALLEAGLMAVNIANGSKRNHQSGERVTRTALAEMAHFTFTLWDRSA